MKRKPHPNTAATLVSQYLAKLGLVVSDRQAKDIVAIVEGYKNWQTYQALEGARAEKAPSARYAQVWAAITDAVTDQLLKTQKAIHAYFGTAFTMKGYALHPPKFDESSEEWSGSIAVTDAQGQIVLTLTLSLIEDEDAPQGAFSVRRELIARGVEEEDEPRVLLSSLATSQATASEKVYVAQVPELSRWVEDSFSASEVVYAIENERLFR